MSSCDFQKAMELIDKSKSVFITTHTRPDGDACGAAVAMSEALSAIGKKTKLLTLSDVPEWYRFLFEEQPEIFNENTKINAD